jgi:hypothetical protein
MKIVPFLPIEPVWLNIVRWPLPCGKHGGWPCAILERCGITINIFKLSLALMSLITNEPGDPEEISENLLRCVLRFALTNIAAKAYILNRHRPDRCSKLGPLGGGLTPYRVALTLEPFTALPFAIQYACNSASGDGCGAVGVVVLFTGVTARRSGVYGHRQQQHRVINNSRALLSIPVYRHHPRIVYQQWWRFFTARLRRRRACRRWRDKRMRSAQQLAQSGASTLRITSHLNPMPAEEELRGASVCQTSSGIRRRRQILGSAWRSTRTISRMDGTVEWDGHRRMTRRR